MAKARKDGRVLNILLNSQIHDELDTFCQEFGYSKTGVVEQALKEFFERHAKKQQLLQAHADELES